MTKKIILYKLSITNYSGLYKIEDKITFSSQFEHYCFYKVRF